MTLRKFSKEPITTKLYVSDDRYLRKKLRDEGDKDIRFKDRASAVRHYVRLGIATEERTTAANTLSDRIVKTNQKEVVTESLLPLKNTIDDLIKEIADLKNKQQDFFTENQRSNDQVRKRFEGVTESLTEVIKSQLSNILKPLLIGDRTNREVFRNVIVLRSIMYVFLMGTKAGRIDPDKVKDWGRVINFAHEKAQTLSLEELTNLEDNIFEKDVVIKLSRELFEEIGKLQKDIQLS